MKLKFNAIHPIIGNIYLRVAVQSNKKECSWQ